MKKQLLFNRNYISQAGRPDQSKKRILFCTRTGENGICITINPDDSTMKG